MFQYGVIKVFIFMDSNNVELIGKLIEGASIKNKEFIKNIKVVKNKFYDNDIAVEFTFHHGVLDNSQREDFMDEVWTLIYNYLDIPVFIVQKGQKIKMNEQEDKEINLVKSFLETQNIEGICEFIVDDEKINGLVCVYVVIDFDWLKEIHTKPEFVATRLRNGIKSEIQKYLGFDVYVGSTARKCQ